MNNSESKYKKRSQLGSIWKRLRKNKTAVAGLCVICIFVLIAIFADVIADYSTMAIRMNAAEALQPPGVGHLFGTDEYGRDVFARVVHGSRVSISIGLLTVSIAVAFGGLLGSIAGYFGGPVDNIIMRIMDTVMSIPAVLLTLSIVAALGPGMVNLLWAMAIATIPGFTRVIRSVVLPTVNQDFVEAAKACGTSNRRIILRHIIPNAIGPIIVQATMAISGMILAAAALSFIGMGIQPPRPEWGSMLSSAREYMMNSPYLVVFPGLAIVTVALSFNLFGDGLRDALDPRLKN